MFNILSAIKKATKYDNDWKSFSIIALLLALTFLRLWITSIPFPIKYVVNHKSNIKEQLLLMIPYRDKSWIEPTEKLIESRKSRAGLK